MKKNVLNETKTKKVNSKNIFDTIEDNVDLSKRKETKKTKRGKEYIPDNFTVGNVDNSTVYSDQIVQENMFLKPFKWVCLGFLFECYILFLIFKYALFALAIPFIFLHLKSVEMEKKAALKREAKERQMIKEMQERALRKQKHSNDRIKNSRVILDDVQEDFISDNKPRTWKDKVSNWFNELPFVKKRFTPTENDKEIVMKFDSADSEKSPFKVVYEYRAKAPDGKLVVDYFDAYSKIEVYSFLVNEGFKVYSIRTSKSIQLLHSNIGGTSVKFKSKDLIFFLTQLSTYLKAGIPLIDSLKILARQYQKNKKYQKVFRKMLYDLTMGESLSTALDRQGGTFPRLLINMVKAAELTGELPDTLDRMAQYFTDMHKTKQQMITALTYPAILFTLSLGVFIFIMLYVVPKFVSIYNAMENVQLPGITRAILNLSEFLKHNIIWLLLGITLIIIILMYLYKNIKSFRRVIQQFLMKLPVFGNIIIFNEVTLFAQTLGTLLSHNVFITDSMEIMNKITNNEIYKSIILSTIDNIAKGDKISTSFNHWAFPIPAYEMVVTGEKTGQLPEMMEKVGSYYQELHRNEVARIKTFLEPILIIFLTIIVGVIVLAIVIPMFNMYGAIEGF